VKKKLMDDFQAFESVVRACQENN